MKKNQKGAPWKTIILAVAVPAILIPMTSIAWKRLGDVWAAPAKIEATVQKVETIEEYISEQRETQQMIQKSPPGFRWDERVEEFVIDPNDPRLKKKGEVR